MRTEGEKKKLKVFLVVLGILALIINSYFFRPGATATFQTPQQQSSISRQSSVDSREAERQAAQKAAEEHQRFLARYLNAGHSREPGKMLVAVAAVSENGRFNHALDTAIADRFRSGAVEASSSLFTSEFVSDGLFRATCDDPEKVLKQLEIAKSVDAILLARQTVEYSQDPSLDNVISANMHLEILEISASQPDSAQTWTLSASGAGFTQKDARALAEERLIKQIVKDDKMSLNRLPKTY